MSVLRRHNNKTHGGLCRVCATGMYRSIEHVKFPKVQTGIFVEWKAPQNPSSVDKDWNPYLESGIHGVGCGIQDCHRFPYLLLKADLHERAKRARA